MTQNQWRLLEILAHWGGMGTIEVEIQFGEYAPNTDAEDDYSGFRNTRLVVAGLMRTLVKKGLAVLDAEYPACGYDITEKGRAVLERHELLCVITMRSANQESLGHIHGRPAGPRKAPTEDQAMMALGWIMAGLVVVVLTIENCYYQRQTAKGE